MSKLTGFISAISNKLNNNPTLIRAVKGFAKWMGDRSNEDGMGTFSYWIVLIIYTIVMLMIMLPIVLVLIVLTLIEETFSDTEHSDQDKNTD